MGRLFAGNRGPPGCGAIIANCLTLAGLSGMVPDVRRVTPGRLLRHWVRGDRALWEACRRAGGRYPVPSYVRASPIILSLLAPDPGRSRDAHRARARPRAAGADLPQQAARAARRPDLLPRRRRGVRQGGRAAAGAPGDHRPPTPAAPAPGLAA